MSSYICACLDENYKHGFGQLSKNLLHNMVTTMYEHCSHFKPSYQCQGHICITHPIYLDILKKSKVKNKKVKHVCMVYSSVNDKHEFWQGLKTLFTIWPAMC